MYFGWKGFDMGIEMGNWMRIGIKIRTEIDVVHGIKIWIWMGIVYILSILSKLEFLMLGE